MLLVPVYSFATEFQSRFLLLWYLSIYETVAYLQWMPLVLCKYDGHGKKIDYLHRLRHFTDAVVRS